MSTSRIGTFLTQRESGEPYKVYIPAKLPPDPAVDLQGLYAHLGKATLAIAELNTVAKSIPNTALFIYMYVRKEALLSSQIEGTQSSFNDLMLFEHQQKPNVSIDDIEEVSNYVRAINYGLERLRNGFPLSLRLLREIHNVLLSGSRGSRSLPGEFRRSQNWIGGTRPGNAYYVPPPQEYLMDCLGNLEQFLHIDENKLPVLIKAGIAHVQFETIHPFLDGNGRLGRLLIILILYSGSLLKEPILYLSLYLKQNRNLYYDLLQEVRLHGNWETWLEFFLDGIYQSAKQAVHTAHKINALFTTDIEKIENLGRAKFSCRLVLEYLKTLPQVTVGLIASELNITAPTARSSLNHLVNLGVIKEVSGKERNKIYVYRNYLDILEEGAEPIK